MGVSEKVRLLYIALQDANTTIVQFHKTSSLKRNEQKLSFEKSHAPNRHTQTETSVPLKADLSTGVD